MNLLKVELKKILPFKPLWIFAALYLLGLPLAFNFFKVPKKNNGPMLDFTTLYGFPEVWHNLSWIASFFFIVPGVLIIMLISNEYTYRTLRQNIIYGYSKLQFLTGKVLLIILFSTIGGVYLFILGLLFGLSYTPSSGMEAMFKEVYYVPLFALQVFSYMVMALFISILVKRSAVSMIIYLFYITVIERIIRGRLPQSIQLYFPANSTNDLITFPKKGFLAFFGFNWADLPLTSAVVMTLIYCCLFLYLSFFVLQKRDI